MKQLQKPSGLSQTYALRSVRSQESNSKLSNKSLHTHLRNKRQTFTRASAVCSKNSLSSASNKKEIFKSLESLFDLHKQFRLSVENLLFVSPPYEEKAENSSQDSSSESQFGQTKDFIEQLKPVFCETESSECETHNNLNEETKPTLENLEKIEDISVLSEIEEDNISTMTDHSDCGKKNQTEASLPHCGSPCNPDQSANKCGDDKSIYAPEYPLPHGVGQGIAMDMCQNSDSMISDLPLSESCVIREMTMADEKAKNIRKEIQDLKAVICELNKKCDLTEEDAVTLKNTQDNVMEKIGELNEITRKMQRTIGLVDPSSQTFAKMFNMLPYPHAHEPERPKEKVKCNEEILETVKECCGEKFAFPQVQHHEDNLPRVIVCGNTEENFPKIVVADSRPRSQGNKCMQNLAGKLTDSLTAQEKLARENAQLESGKYLLEKQLMEKDSALDCIQRKICGLQAEMRLIAKENSDLHQKVACLQKNSCPPPPCPPPPCPPPPCPPPPCPPPRCPPPPCPPPPCPPKTPPCPKPQTPPCPKPQTPPCPRPKTPPCPQPSCPPSARSTPKSCQSTGQKDTFGTSKCSGDQSNEVYGNAKSCCNKSSRLAGGASKSNGCCSSNRQEMQQRSGTGGNCPNSPPSQGRGRPCPTDMEKRLQDYGNNTKSIDEQLSCIENQVSALTQQMMSIRRDRQQLDMQHKHRESAGGGSSPHFGCPDTTTSTCPPQQNNDNCMSSAMCNDPPPEPNSCVAQRLRDLQEQYARLQDDYKSKLCEVSRLRCDSETLRREVREVKEERERVEIKLVDAQERLRVIEAERNELLGSKEQLIEQEQALLVARQRFREAQDELEELRSLICDQAAQLDDYRNKYLQAQQQVEEQRRQMDLMEMDNARMNENVTLEISRVKNQFQEKLAELAPLSDILKQTQIKLQESQQLRMVAEHNCEDLSRELLGAKEKIDCMQNQMNELQREIQALQDDKTESCMRIEELERKNGEMRNEIERMKNTICRLEEQLTCAQKRLDEKQHEIVQLTAMLEQVREDSARQVARTKERSEAIKRSMQAEISDFEIQLAQCRAAAKTAQKERDEIRQKMQGQICNLNETLQQAQGRIRSLQGHVDYLKVSYSNIFTNQGQGEAPSLSPQTEASNTGYDTCDCSH